MERAGTKRPGRRARSKGVYLQQEARDSTCRDRAIVPFGVEVVVNGVLGPIPVDAAVERLLAFGIAALYDGHGSAIWSEKGHLRAVHSGVTMLFAKRVWGPSPGAVESDSVCAIGCYLRQLDTIVLRVRVLSMSRT